MPLPHSHRYRQHAASVFAPAMLGCWAAVLSLCTAQPIKIADFDFDLENEFFEGASRYSEWDFLYRVPAVAARPVPAAGVWSLRP